MHFKAQSLALELCYLRNLCNQIDMHRLSQNLHCNSISFIFSSMHVMLNFNVFVCVSISYMNMDVCVAEHVCLACVCAFERCKCVCVCISNGKTVGLCILVQHNLRQADTEENAYKTLSASSPPSVLFSFHLSFLMSWVFSPPNKIPLALNEVELAASRLHLI